MVRTSEGFKQNSDVICLCFHKVTLGWEKWVLEAISGVDTRKPVRRPLSEEDKCELMAACPRGASEGGEGRRDAAAISEVNLQNLLAS